MNFRIADTFTSSLARLTSQEQKAVKTTAFDLQMDASAPGLSFHKLDRAQDKNFWSVRVNLDIRVIVHKTPQSLLLAYVDHHDEAYKWAERRKIERHPTTGAMQLVELVEAGESQRWYTPPDPDEDIHYEQRNNTPVLIFNNVSETELLSYGVPTDWLIPVKATTEEMLFDVINHLPQEAQEALLSLAIGEKPIPPKPISTEADPFAHPDAQRRFRELTNVDELRQALDYPWDKWAVFLHPAQAALTTKNFAGAARVAGSAGTGKTIVALHRAVELAKANPTARVLLTTFSKPLANALRHKLKLLIGDAQDVFNRITVDAFNSVAYNLYLREFSKPNIIPAQTLHTIILQASASIEGHKFSSQFLVREWNEIVDAWQLKTWDEYKDVKRLGRKTRVSGKQREVLWSIFEHTRAALEAQNFVTWSDVFGTLTQVILTSQNAMFDYCVIDECQDLDVSQARFLAAIGANRANALFFAGDLGQRIFQTPFSWSALGLDVRGRSSTLRINYRTSHQIRTRADRLLPTIICDIDGLSQTRKGTVSLFEGAPPTISIKANEQDEQHAVANWIKTRIEQGCKPQEIAVFVRSDSEFDRAKTAVKDAGFVFYELNNESVAPENSVIIGMMHLAKGHEFKAVVVMACDEDVMPLKERIETAADEADLEEVYNSERNLLYVACTRARDHLIITAVSPGSEFINDLDNT